MIKRYSLKTVAIPNNQTDSYTKYKLEFVEDDRGSLCLYKDHEKVLRKCLKELENNLNDEFNTILFGSN
ncbi:MAG: hypothetical protein PHG08_00690 [Bacilli bacterium]|nr:hypothetical protein [Bacilli bacterium]